MPLLWCLFSVQGLISLLQAVRELDVGLAVFLISNFCIAVTVVQLTTVWWFWDGRRVSAAAYGFPKVAGQFHPTRSISCDSLLDHYRFSWHLSGLCLRQGLPALFALV